jgi:hypothetical protein
MNVFEGFPYPVLLADGLDFLEGEFSWQLEDGVIRLGSDEITFTARFELTQEYLTQMLEAGKVVFNLEIHCPSTFYRRSENFTENLKSFSIPSDEVRGEVILSAHILANENIEGYSPDPVSDFFEGTSFTINKGDVLAFGGTTSFIADKEFDPLKAPVSSFIKVREEKGLEGPMLLNYSGDEILIMMGAKDYKLFQSAKELPEMLHSSVVLPALVDALNAMNKEKDRPDGAWCQKLRKICEAHRVTYDDAFEAAQKLLRNPINRSLERYVSFAQIETEEDFYESEDI